MEPRNSKNAFLAITCVFSINDFCVSNTTKNILRYNFLKFEKEKVPKMFLYDPPAFAVKSAIISLQMTFSRNQFLYIQNYQSSTQEHLS